MTKVGFLIAATGRYVGLASSLIASIREHLVGMEPRFFVFTDSETDGDYVRIPVTHEPWPLSTMRRCCRYQEHAGNYDGCDYLFAIDADMRFQGTVGTEILGEVVGTQHPGFYAVPNTTFTYERQAESAACIPMGKGTRYYACAFQGGSRKQYLERVNRMCEMIEADRQRGIVPVWHDESYWNRCLFDQPPSLVLSPSYCYPEGWKLPFDQKIIALNKNHQQMRSP